MDKDTEVIEEELGESMEAAEAVLDRSDTEVGELFPSRFVSITLFKSFTNSK